jgi:transketolase
MDNSLVRKANQISLDHRSRLLRLLILDALNGGGRGHLGPALSLVEIIRVLYDFVMIHDPKNALSPTRDRFVLSKGHGCLGLYAVLANHGYFPVEKLKDFCRFDSNLGGHPESSTLSGIEISTGSLGHGLSVGVGMAMASRLKDENWRTFVLLGDGETNEGSIWEAAMHASQHQLGRLTVIVDFNRMQAYGDVNSVISLATLPSKWESFGFEVIEVNGHDISQLIEVLGQSTRDYRKPRAIIAYTIKGKGIASAENSTDWHHKARISADEILILREELMNK